MDDIIKLFGVIAAVSMAGAGAYAVVALTGAFARRLERRGGPDTERLQSELADLRLRLDESDEVRARVTEVEERLDFAERLLAQRNEPARLSAGDDPR
jgi:hypothetical protein